MRRLYRLMPKNGRVSPFGHSLFVPIFSFTRAGETGTRRQFSHLILVTLSIFTAEHFQLDKATTIIIIIINRPHTNMINQN